MPPEETIRELETTLPKDEKPFGKVKMFLILFLLIAAVSAGAYYYLLPSEPKKADISPVVAGEKNAPGVLTDAITGKPMPQEEVNRIKAEIKANAKMYVLSGNVVSIDDNVIGVEYGKTVVKLALKDDSKILLGGEDIQEKLIEPNEIEKGLFLTVVFLQGKTEAELSSGSPITVKNIKVFSGERITEAE
ncbi:MAG: hypothetical protein WCT49_06405 [Candidatus Paceibacterota bacterium]|jgi:hypothetical protein|nr:hypothetical protein [Candidatus Paceibacterota bacterium]